MQFKLAKHLFRSPLNVLLPGLLLTLLYALGLRFYLTHLPPVKSEWYQIVAEPVPPGYTGSALALRAHLDQIFCAVLSVWMGWRYRNGRAWPCVLTLLASAVVLPWLLLTVSETYLDWSARLWTMFWLPLQLAAIMLAGQTTGWLSACGWAKYRRHARRDVHYNEENVPNKIAYPDNWVTIGDALLHKARQDAKTYALDVNMNAARRGLRAGIADVEQILSGVSPRPDAASLRLLQQHLQQRKYCYLAQSGDDGVWECSVIAMAIEEIDSWLKPPTY